MSSYGRNTIRSHPTRFILVHLQLWKYFLELFAMLADKIGDECTQFSFTHIGTGEIGLEEIGLELLSGSQFVAFGLLVQLDGLVTFLGLCLQHFIAISFGQRLTKVGILAVCARYLQIMDRAQGHAQRVQALLLFGALSLLNVLAQLLFQRKFSRLSAPKSSSAWTRCA